MNTFPSQTEQHAAVKRPAARASKIIVDSLSKTYTTKSGSFTALDQVSAHILENEFVTLVGPSGCGKSTMLRVLAGLEEASSGSASIAGRRITGPGADRGVVFQSYTLFPWLSVRDNIEFGLELKGTPKLQRLEVSDKYLELVGLTKFADAYPKQLSGGMKQRVAIARALANSPEMLLMDEPFAALDAQTRSDMQELLMNIQKHEHATILFITHDIDEAIFLSERLYVMKSRPGRIVREIEIPAAMRQNKELRDSEPFIQLKREIVDLLHA
ncbi:NitT/TauT family transport system ATP-binding protein [Paenibacillus algorifonticola]|uniref:NitT/TauT family transport system ATP-binding protein n=1 Tax=Paenibacillus algorifonticola TaxID=684063 RepID=A0A1I1Z2U3_9BACL|nr:ABC transporter ATP-binding protein [Paenibacillus algorifonticola]SFE25997.1 NitT/TauT family transport system ATP-binding protein [Paenibacillus algorifonticola]